MADPQSFWVLYGHHTKPTYIEMKRDKRSGTVAKCESILKELGYRYMEHTKSDEVWIRRK